MGAAQSKGARGRPRTPRRLHARVASGTRARVPASKEDCKEAAHTRGTALRCECTGCRMRRIAPARRFHREAQLVAVARRTRRQRAHGGSQSHRRWRYLFALRSRRVEDVRRRQWRTFPRFASRWKAVAARPRRAGLDMPPGSRALAARPDRVFGREAADRSSRLDSLIDIGPNGRLLC